MDNGADIDALNHQGFTALHIAAKAGNEGICSLLLERSANPNIKGHRSKTPLHKAKHPKIVQLLLQKGSQYLLILLYITFFFCKIDEVFIGQHSGLHSELNAGP